MKYVATSKGKEFKMSSLSNRRRQRRRRKVYPKLWFTNIEADTLDNRDWRRVLFTSSRLQVVVMSVPPGESLGWEVHRDSDQFFRVEQGEGLFETGNARDLHDAQYLDDGMVTVIPRGTWHNVTNVSDRQPLQLYAIYAPPHHPRGTRDRTHADEKKRIRA